MARKRSNQPTDAELEILTVLWGRGPSPLGDVVAERRTAREVATTTVATMLKIMLDKKLVSRRKKDKRWVWAAAITRDDTRRRLVGRVLDAVFEGSARDLVAHIVENERLSDEERIELRRLLEGDDA